VEAESMESRFLGTKRGKGRRGVSSDEINGLTMDRVRKR